jgi:hypothetical protein
VAAALNPDAMDKVAAMECGFATARPPAERAAALARAPAYG